MAYAEKTSVPVDRSKSEIERTLVKYGATAFMFAAQNDKAMIVFEIKGLRIKFILPLPESPSSNATGVSIKNHEQKLRSKWRSLLLCIKAKLEAVDANITTFEQEFLAHIVLSNGMVVGEVMIPQIQDNYKTGNMPKLLT